METWFLSYYAGLLQTITMVSASHSSTFYVASQFHSLMVNIRYSTVCAICAHMTYCKILLLRLATVTDGMITGESEHDVP